MAKFEYTYIVLKDEDEVFESTSQVSLTKKDIQEMEEFIKEHNYSYEFVDVPGKVYDKCFEKAFEKALREYPVVANEDEGYFLDLEEFVPKSFIDQMSEETQKILYSDYPYLVIDNTTI